MQQQYLKIGQSRIIFSVNSDLKDGTRIALESKNAAQQNAWSLHRRFAGCFCFILFSQSKRS